MRGQVRLAGVAARAVLVAAAFLSLAGTASAAESAFRAAQLENARVREAHGRRGEAVRQMFLDRDLPWPPRGIVLRAFKQEAVLELWGRRADEDRYELVREYPICSASGTLGPKRRQGDLQVPEGFYFLNHFNPASNYHLSLGVSYPNQSDRILSRHSRLGGSIYVHGDCVTIGCIPLTDAKIEEVYLAALEARAAGQVKIPIHIFPARLDEAGLKRLRGEGWDEGMLEFWANLAEGYAFFERERRPPVVSVDRAGRYEFGEARGRAVRAGEANGEVGRLAPAGPVARDAVPASGPSDSPASRPAR